MCRSRFCREQQVTTLMVLQLLMNSSHMLFQVALRRRQIVAQFTSETNPLVNRLYVKSRSEKVNSKSHSKHRCTSCIWIDSRWSWRPQRDPNILSQYSHLIRSFTISNEVDDKFSDIFRRSCFFVVFKVTNRSKWELFFEIVFSLSKSYFVKCLNSMHSKHSKTKENNYNLTIFQNKQKNSFFLKNHQFEQTNNKQQTKNSVVKRKTIQ